MPTPVRLITYTPKPAPTLGSDQLYLQQELAAISNAINMLILGIKSVEARLTALGG